MINNHKINKKKQNKTKTKTKQEKTIVNKTKTIGRGSQIYHRVLPCAKQAMKPQCDVLYTVSLFIF